MIFEKYNSHSKFHLDTIAAKKKAIERADAIICVSKSTKKDLLTYYPNVVNKAFVVYHGISKPLLVEKNKHNKPYLFYVGHRDWYKNFKTLLEVYAANKNLNNEFDLICFGGVNFSDEEKKYFSNYLLIDKIKQVSGNDDLLNTYYSNATAFIYLSEYEGFGMPVLEAMSNGCPVICSNTSSLPEVAGDAAILINPLDKEALTNSLEKIISNTEVKNELKLFSWDTCASETNLIYLKLK
jgi:glycosyltransferase involved in cell wall biosynthesis